MAIDRITSGRELIAVLFDRGASPAEINKIQSIDFDYDKFVVDMLCSDESIQRYGDIAQYLMDHVRSELASSVLPHKVAHDLVLLSEELEKAQARFDGLHGKILELLKHEDRIASLFDAVRDTQAELNAIRRRIEQIETGMLVLQERKFVEGGE